MIMCNFGESLCVFNNVNADEEFITTHRFDRSLSYGRWIELFFYLWNSTKYLFESTFILSLLQNLDKYCSLLGDQ